MQLGEKAELIIKPEYAYGQIGAPPKIPGNATLIFTIEVI
jgi:FKBP-type peptidyl-prolyl cis-trans isomerase